MTSIKAATLTPTGSTFQDGTNSEYQWSESSDVDGATGWDSASAFVAQCLDGVEVVKNPSFSIHNLPDGAVIVTPEAGEDGHMVAFALYWLPRHLRDLREAAGLTQAKSAAAMGKGLRYYQSLESGAAPIEAVALGAALKLAAAFGVSPEELL